MVLSVLVELLVCVRAGACARVCKESRTAARWWEGGCSVAACPGAGRARRRPTTPTMLLERAARNSHTTNLVSVTSLSYTYHLVPVSQVPGNVSDSCLIDNPIRKLSKLCQISFQ